MLHLRMPWATPLVTGMPMASWTGSGGGGGGGGGGLGRRCSQGACVAP